jgi:hypothetical protein
MTSTRNQERHVKKEIKPEPKIVEIVELSDSELKLAGGVTTAVTGVQTAECPTKFSKRPCCY